MNKHDYQPDEPTRGFDALCATNKRPERRQKLVLKDKATLAVRVEQSFKSELEAFAAANGMTPAAISREAVYRGLREMRREWGNTYVVRGGGHSSRKSSTPPASMRVPRGSAPGARRAERAEDLDDAQDEA